MTAEVRMAVGGAIALAAVMALTPTAGDAGDLLTRNTARLALMWYLAAICQMLWLGPRDWAVLTKRGQVARWCWTWAVGCLVCHIAVALHFFDHWSHAHALERTREVSGLAEGLYVSYLVALLWAADALWWWLNPAGYANRSVWIDRAWHALLLFVIFNSTVVYESGAIRWIAALAFAALAVIWLASRRRRERP